MTDSEIVKALECCVSSKHICPHTCPMLKNRECLESLRKNALDLINRQKAENTELQLKNSELEIELKAMRGAANSYKAEIERLKNLDTQIEVSKKLEREIKSEAYKEFVERLKETKFKHGNDFIVYADNIDNLLKELVGGSDVTKN